MSSRTTSVQAQVGGVVVVGLREMVVAVSLVLLLLLTLLPVLAAGQRSECEQLAGWDGTWWVKSTAGYLTIRGSTVRMGGGGGGGGRRGQQDTLLTCVQSFPSTNTFVFTTDTNCYLCYQFFEMHRNVLHYRQVPAGVGSCQLRSMPECSGRGSRDVLPKYMIREGSSVPCPNLGVVPFTYERSGTYCGADPSRLTSTGKTLNFAFRPCQSQSLTSPAQNSEPSLQTLECVGWWERGRTVYLMARRGTFHQHGDGTFSPRRGGSRGQRPFTRQRDFSLLQGGSSAPQSPYVCLNFTRQPLTYNMDQAMTEMCDFMRDQDPYRYFIHLNGAQNVAIPGSTLVPRQLGGSGDTVIVTQPFQSVTLTCTAPVHLNFAEGQPALQPYLMKWLRYIDGVEEMVSSDQVTLLTDRGRLDLNTAPLGDGNTRYDLVINPVGERDSGLYTCVLNSHDFSVLLTRNITLAVSPPPPAGECELPVSWHGSWWDKYEFNLDLSYYYLGDDQCVAASGNTRFLMQQPNNCKVCYIISEKHHNVLQYWKSPCSFSDSLEAVCAKVEHSLPLYLVRKDALVSCPFLGVRAYTFQDSQGRGCIDHPSTLTSTVGNTELVFSDSPCHSSTNSIAPRNKTVKCVAGWSEGRTHYLMGQVSASKYLCYTYVMEPLNGYLMSHAGDEECRPWGGLTHTLYHVDRAQEDFPLPIHLVATTPQPSSGNNKEAYHFLTLVPLLCFLLHCL